MRLTRLTIRLRLASYIIIVTAAATATATAIATTTSTRACTRDITTNASFKNTAFLNFQSAWRIPYIGLVPSGGQITGNSEIGPKFLIHEFQNLQGSVPKEKSV